MPSANPLPATPFWFMRHGQTDWNVVRRLQGHTDVPLNATGLQQAQTAALRLRQLPIGLIISSPLQRAAATAAVIQQHTGLPLHHDDRLKERGFGAFEGLTRSAILQSLGRAAHEDFYDRLPPDSESPAALMARIQGVLAEQLASHHPNNVLFVGHGAFMAHLCELLDLNSNIRFENATPYHFRPTAMGWQMEVVDL